MCGWNTSRPSPGSARCAAQRRARRAAASLSVVAVEGLLGVPLTAMRAGYVRHRHVHRLPAGRAVPLVLGRRRREGRTASVPQAARDLHEAFVRRTREAAEPR